MVKIAPSLLSADMARLKEEVELVERSGADLIHVDVMDGHFVPNITFGPGVVSALRGITTLPLDVHLMVEEPIGLVSPFAEAGANILSVHVESTRNLHRLVKEIKSAGMKAGVALNPATPVCSLEWLLDSIDLVVVMGVNPGYGGQAFIPFTTAKVRRVSRMLRRQVGGGAIDIEVDGGVTEDNAREIASAGASILVAGSALFRESGSSMESRIAKLKGKPLGPSLE